MTQAILAELIGIEGWGVRGKPHFEKEEVHRPFMMVEIYPEKKEYECPCGRCFDHYYDGEFRMARDLSFGIWDLYLYFFQVRVECPDCGVKTERVPWLDRGQRHTKRFAAYVAGLCRIASVSAVAERLDLNWKTAKRFDKQALEAELNPPDLKGLRILAVDEIAIKKGHKYATVILDFETRRVVWAVEDRTEEALCKFYEILGKAGCEKIEAVAMDMWPAYESATRRHCPNAEIVYDKFHLISGFSRVVDEVRNAELKKAEKEDKPALKGTKYLLLRNWENLKPDQKDRLDELLALNRSLNTVYILKEELSRMWDYKYPGAARNFFEGWCQMAVESNIEPLLKFAKTLARHWEGIAAHCRHPIHTSVLEGVNNKAKVIKRVAFGFHAPEYFFLKLRAAFPGG